MANIYDDIPADLAEEAIVVQDACNASGVIHAMSRAVTKIWEQAREKGQGTDWVNRHPVMVLFASKLADLTQADLRFSKSYDLCYGASKKVPV